MNQYDLLSVWMKHSFGKISAEIKFTTITLKECCYHSKLSCKLIWVMTNYSKCRMNWIIVNLCWIVNWSFKLVKLFSTHPKNATIRLTTRSPEPDWRNQTSLCPSFSSSQSSNFICPKNRWIHFITRLTHEWSIKHSKF